MTKRQQERIAKELKAIKTMSYKDMQSDKIAAGKALIGLSAAAGLTAASVSLATGGTAPAYLTASFALNASRFASDAKTKNRIKRYDNAQRK